MNDNSQQANILAQAVAATVKSRIAEYVSENGPVTAEQVGKALGIKSTTFWPRFAEMKGVSLGHNFSVVRTGETLKQEGSAPSDYLVHVSKATPTQIQNHILWVKKEREKKAADFQRWIEKLQKSPLPVPEGTSNLS